jgi:hypothetical protein
MRYVPWLVGWGGSLMTVPHKCLSVPFEECLLRRIGSWQSVHAEEVSGHIHNITSIACIL